MAARRARLRRAALERLEARTLMATTPPVSYMMSPPIPGQPQTPVPLTTLAGSGPFNSTSSPQVVIDRYDPLKMVAVWVDYSFAGPPTATVEGAYSTDGGKTWSGLGNAAPPTLIDPNSSPTNAQPFHFTTDPTVGFDAQNQFYILAEEHPGAADFSSGALIFNKFDFNGSVPILEAPSSTDNIIYEWTSSTDGATAPSLVVDDNQASFTDPTTKVVQKDPYANNMYVSWATIDQPPPNAVNFNPNSIRFAASSDGGQTWSNSVLLNPGHYGSQRNGAPKMTVSQGGPTVPGGQVTTVWDDYGSGSQANPPFDLIMSARDITGGTGWVTDSIGGTINPATGSNPTVPVITTFPINVSINNPQFTTLTSLSVTLNIQDSALNDLSARLIGPGGQVVTLFQRRGSNANIGIGGANMGQAPDGEWLGATFDDTAARNIRVGNAPYVGHYTPETGTMIAPFVGDAPAALNGNWTLELTNYNNNANPVPQLINWSLNLTSGNVSVDRTTVAQTLVRGSQEMTNTPWSAPSTPNGISPGAVIASDNTLGSFSPFQGNLYVAYVNYVKADGNPTTNTDIALMVSSDGGVTWKTLTTKVNDDNGVADGFSGATNRGTVNGRSQYMPAITVDQATGMLVLSWRDARYDVTNARVATFLTTSIDGGKSFSPDVYANPQNTAVDTITGKTVVYGPRPDNQSGGIGPDAVYSYGTDMGLAAYDGVIIPVWAGDLDRYGSAPPVNGHTDIYARLMVSAAGPRIIGSTMGPVGLPGDTVNTAVGPDGSPKPNHIQVTFDRPVDPSTFTAADVEVFYKGLTAGSPMLPVLVTGVIPIQTNQYGATRFQVTFDPTKNADGTARPSPVDFTGTYSYLIKPGISDRIRTLSLPQVSQPVINQGSGPINLPIAGGPSGSTTTASTIMVSGYPASQYISSITVSLDATFPVDGDLTLVLVGPNGTQTTLYQNPTDNGHDFTGTTFDDNAGQSIFGGTAPYTGRFIPVSPLNAQATQTVNGGYVLKIINRGPATITGVLKDWSIQIKSIAPPSSLVLSDGNLMDQNADAVQGSDATVTPFTGLTPGDVYAIPAPVRTVPTTFNLTNGNFPAAPYSQDTLPLIATGPHIAGTSVPSPGYQAGSSDNLVLNNKTSAIDVTFDRDMNPGTITAAQVLQIMGPTGRIDAPQTFALPASSQNQTIPGGTGVPFVSSLTVPNDLGTFPIAHLAVQLNIQAGQDAPLTAILIAPNGSSVQLFSGVPGQNFVNTVLDDSATTALTAGTSPYSGVFKPANSLQAFVQPGGVPMDLGENENQRTWKLEILNSKTGNVSKLVSWSLIATPQISITPNPNGTDPNAASPRTYRVNFPMQELSGTYTVQLASTIKSAAGDALDSNDNAGLEVLKGGGTSVATASVSYTGSNLPQPVPVATTDAKGNAIPGQLISTINVPDNFTVQGVTAAGLPGLTVKLNLSGAADPDLEAQLVYHLGQADQVTVPLFNYDGLTPVGNVGTNQTGFQDTVFTDLSPTPIQNGGAPFFGTTGFRSQNPLLSSSSYTDAQGTIHFTPGFTGLNVGGAWTLVVKDHNPGGSAGQLNSWSLTFQKPLPSTGLGEPVADQATTSFRIFTMDPANPLSSDQWTAVGPASIGGGSGSGRIGGLAVDPSDPSGNTVYVGGASGGVWKTTNFLDPKGPTYIPLTDFGPTFSLNIGGIAVFPRNNDPRQSIVIAATGEGDTGSPGVGFLISKDGGATWNLYDSTKNVDSSGNLLPFDSPNRDHKFVGDSAFKVLVDPKLSPNGQVIIYAALSGPNGGIWRSQDTGQTWNLMRGGEATDVAFDLLSGTGAPGGNIQIIYGAFRGEGVYLSPNQGQVWNQMTGTIGNPLLLDPTATPQPQNVNPATQPSPNGGQGRIVLATPVPLPNQPDANLIYQGWLYAAVITPGGGLNGLYLTKDFGQNWTKVRIPTLATKVGVANPTNDIGQPDYDIGGGPPGSGFGAQGNYDVSLALDPTNPNIAYLGGTADGQDTGFIRIDVTNLWDAHNATAFDENGILGGTGAFQTTTGPLSLRKPPPVGAAPSPFTNVIGYSNGYVGQQFVRNGLQFTNNGAGAEWIPFDLGGTDQHRIVTTVDPITGHARLIIGDDQGVFTTVDNNGLFDSGIGTRSTAIGPRNGNLQITQFYYGASQPSNVAAQAAAALFYGSAQDDGAPQSDPNVLNNGNLSWNQAIAFNQATGFFHTIGDATGVAADQTGSGGHYQYAWPCCGGDYTEFFLDSTGSGPLIGQTNGLLQQSNGLPTPDPQWPSTGGSNFAVNPIDGNQVIISSQAGRIFRTETALQSNVNWFEIGNPGALDSSYAPALAFGAPDPGAPSGIGNLDNFLYAGTSGGHIYVTQDGGGASGNNWTNISLGLDGTSVQQIITDPTRGSHDAYAVTRGGHVYFLPDSIALANDPANTALEWQDITGNIGSFLSNPFGTGGISETLLGGGLRAIQADWRYTLPNNPTANAGPNTATHPILYVAGYSGVYRSLDNGKTWTVFPNQASNGSPVDGGYLPNAEVTSLTMAIGNVDVNTGRAVQSPGDPNVLLASTYGRGFFAIRLAPVIFPSSVALSTTSPAPAGSNGGTAPDGTPLVTVAQPVFNGVSEQSAFGNKVRISIYDLTNPLSPRLIGGYDGVQGDATDIAANQTDAYGNFSVQLNPKPFSTNGPKVIGIQATDDSGTKGNMIQFPITYETSGGGQGQPPTPPTLALSAGSDSSHGQGITNVTTPTLVGVTSPNVTVALVDGSGNPVPGVATVTSDPATGAFTLQFTTPLTDGTYQFRAAATNSSGTTYSPFVSFTVKTVGPKTNTFAGLTAASDSGIKGDNVTNVRRPVFAGKTDPGALVDLLQVGGGGTDVLASVTAQSDGSYSIQLPADLTDGTISLETRVHDVAGNFGPTSQAVQVRITSTTGDYNGDSKAEAALFQRTSKTVGTWVIPGVTTGSGIAFGKGSVVPFTGDFNADGVSDLAYYDLAASTWTIETSQGTNLQSGNIQQIPLGQAGAIPVAGAFGGGASEVGVYIAGTGGAPSTWRIVDNTSGLVNYSFGQAGDIPLTGDFLAQGKDQIAVYRPSTGQVLADDLSDPSNPKTVPVATLGANLVPVPGAYDNIPLFQGGKAEPRAEAAVFNASTGVMTIAGPNGSYTVPFNPGDIPAPGDYLGLGEDQPAVYRPSAGAYVVYNPTSQAFTTIQVGITNGVPVLAPYSYRAPSTTKVTTAPTVALLASDDSSNGQAITNVKRPHFVGHTDPNAFVDLIDTKTGNVVGTATADYNGNYSVTPSSDLADGSYTFQTRAYGFDTDPGLKSTGTASVTIQASLRVVSVTPSVGNYASLPGGKIVITFNHPLVGITPDDATGGAFANSPFAVYLAPRGPDGAFLAPSGLDKGSTPIHATLVYHVNANGTSSITLTPQAPLGTDVYLIAVSGNLKDRAGNTLLGAGGTPGNYYSTFNLRTTPPNGTELKVTGVTTLHASVSIANGATIPQPDTIAITFNKPVNFLTTDTTTVQLLAGGTPVAAAVAYSPTTRTVYLTPEAFLTPGTTYTIRVADSVTDDQAFPNPDAAFTLGTAFTRTFQVSGPGVGPGSGPLRILTDGSGHLAISPGAGTRTSPFGYASIAFSEALDLASFKRFSVMLTNQAGGLNNNAFDKADAALNMRLAFNPNTNTLIMVPTVPLASGKYLYTIGAVKATNGDTLTNPNGSLPIYQGFTLSLAQAGVRQQSRSAGEHVASGVSGVAITPLLTGQSTGGSSSTGRSQKPAVHDQAIGGLSVRSLLVGRRGQSTTNDLDRLAAERARGF